jgi:hypothetical protein
MFNFRGGKMTEAVRENVNTVEKLSAKKLELEKEFEQLNVSRKEFAEKYNAVNARQAEIQAQYKLVVDLLPKEQEK